MQWLVVETVPQLGCVSQDSESLESQRGTQSRRNPMQKVWDQFDEYDSHSPRDVKQVSGEMKDHRLKKYKSVILISGVPSLWNFRIASMKRLKDMFFEETPAVLAFKKLCKDYGFSNHWISGQNPHLTWSGNRIVYHVWFLVYQRVLPQLHLHLLHHHLHYRILFFDESRYTENPVSERSGSTSEELRRNLQHKPTENENKK